MYEILIKLQNELQYRKFTIKELTEIKELLEQFTNTEEVRAKRLEKEVSNE